MEEGRDEGSEGGREVGREVGGDEVGREEGVRKGGRKGRRPPAPKGRQGAGKRAPRRGAKGLRAPKTVG
jgi:hypothetical protein